MKLLVIVVIFDSCSKGIKNNQIELTGKIIDKNTFKGISNFQLRITYFKNVPDEIFGHNETVKMDIFKTDSTGKFNFQINVSDKHTEYTIYDSKDSLLLKSNIHGDLGDFYVTL